MPQQDEYQLSPEETREIAGLYRWNKPELQYQELPTDPAERHAFLSSLAPNNPEEFFPYGDTITVADARRIREGFDPWPGTDESVPHSQRQLSVEESPGWRYDTESIEEYYGRTGNLPTTNEYVKAAASGSIDFLSSLASGAFRGVKSLWDAGRQYPEEGEPGWRFNHESQEEYYNRTGETPSLRELSQNLDRRSMVPVRAIGRGISAAYSAVDDRNERLRQDAISRVRGTPEYQRSWLDAVNGAADQNRPSTETGPEDNPIVDRERLYESAYPTLGQQTLGPVHQVFGGGWVDPTESPGYQSRVGTLEGQAAHNQAWSSAQGNLSKISGQLDDPTTTPEERSALEADVQRLHRMGNNE